MIENNETPTSVLRAEHQVILRVINVLGFLVAKSERDDGFEAEALGRCVEFFRFFADACHHAKEEDLLFPALENRGIQRDGGPIGVMLYEHTIARALTKKMGEALEVRESEGSGAEERFHDAAHQYIELLTNHISKEDTVLFNMGDNVLDANDQETLCKQFCEVGCRSFGGKKLEQLKSIADELETQWAS